jgi:hypothetical protein
MADEVNNPEPGSEAAPFEQMQICPKCEEVSPPEAARCEHCGWHFGHVPHPLGHARQSQPNALVRLHAEQPVLFGALLGAAGMLILCWVLALAFWPSHSKNAPDKAAAPAAVETSSSSDPTEPSAAPSPVPMESPDVSPASSPVPSPENPS